MIRLTAPLLISALLLSGCGGRFSDSGLNPFGWFGGGNAPRPTLEPDEGYDSVADARPAIPQITGAAWQPLGEGRLLVVTAMAPTKGYSLVELVTTRPSPGGRILPDPDGVLRLRMVGVPPLPDSPAARMPARPETDLITAAMALSSIQLARITAVEIASASNVVTLRR
ncbi:hypothetical protein JHW45_05780 [Paracoccus stylophorae]|uniref:Lipoprotein n=1 Tax=Paracoccus stylophorae TaxID=659350 RepID=A0ABY7T016_9RHOB|nr:hypothetical protein [Paracoccus stylophorae]WCR11871.1 hypothetical protein JHW45_05780 [Paracoccus stylophorae]